LEEVRKRCLSLLIFLILFAKGKDNALLCPSDRQVFRGLDSAKYMAHFAPIGQPDGGYADGNSRLRPYVQTLRFELNNGHFGK
jgi:hypothetical protein